MIISARQLRSDVKSVFPSLKSFFGEKIHCTNPSYIIPPHDQALELLSKVWEPFTHLSWIRNIGECEVFAKAWCWDVHKYRLTQAFNQELSEDELFRWAFAAVSGLSPKGNSHTFNLLYSSKGIFIYDYGKEKDGNSYKPLLMEL